MNELLEAWRNRRHIAAVDIQENSIRLLEIKKQRGRIKIINAHQHQWQSVDEKHGQPQIEALNFIAREFNLSSLQAVVRLPQSIFRNHFLKLPEDSGGNISGWLAENITQFLPPGLARNQVVYAYRVFPNSTESDKILLVIARRDVISKWLEVFCNLNLRVVELIGNAHALLNGFAFSDPKHYKENRVFLHFEPTCIFLIITQKGDMVHYSEIVPAHSNGFGELDDFWPEMIQKKLMNYKRDNAVHRIILTGENAAGACETLFPKIAKVESGGNLIGNFLLSGENDKFVHLFGLGIQPIYPKFEASDLLPEDFKEEMSDKEQAVNSLHLAGIATVFLILLWLVLLCVNFFAKRELQVWKMETLKLENQIREIEKLKNMRKKLSEDLLMRQEIINQRSHLARTLFTLTEIMPKNVWLRTLSYGQSETDDLEEELRDVPLMLEGLALDQPGPTLLLSEMEKIPEFQLVQLDLMQLIPAKMVFKKTKKRKVPLVKFRISAWEKIDG